VALTKHASFQVLAARIATAGAPLMRTAHRHDFRYEPRVGMLYVRSRAISSRTNDNFDEFPAEEIKKAYRTFIGKPVFVNHHNDDHRRARGVIIDAALHEDANADGSPDTWVEVLMEVDAIHFPMLAKAIVKGEIARTSMGCFVPGTLVTLADGTQKPIESIVVGDEVLTHTGKTEPVTYVLERDYQGVVYDIRAFGQATPLVMTDEHPVWIKRGTLADSIFTGWVEARFVVPGDWVLTPAQDGAIPARVLVGEFAPDGLDRDLAPEGMWRRVTEVDTDDYTGSVYNFDVDGDDSYVAADVAVHNCDVAYSECTVCGNRADTPISYCAHVKRMKGQRIYRTTASGTKEGVLVAERCRGLSFFENSLLVEEPADPSAFVVKVDDHSGMDWGLSTTSSKIRVSRDEIETSRPNLLHVYREALLDGYHETLRTTAAKRGETQPYLVTFQYEGQPLVRRSFTTMDRAELFMDEIRDNADRREMDVSITVTDRSKTSARTAFRRTAVTLNDVERTVAPAQVDTMRTESCPVCFTPETLVRIRDGYVPIASVVVGDEVLSKGGVLAEISALHQRDYDGVLYEISARSLVEPIRVTPEHPIMALASRHPNPKGVDNVKACRPGKCAKYGDLYLGGRWKNQEIRHEVKWVEAQDIREGGFLGINIVEEDFADLTKVSVPVQYLGRKERKGPTEFDLTEEFLWMVGLYLAEGSASARHINFALHEDEVEYVDRLKRLFEGFGYSTATIVRPNNKGVWVEVYSTTLASWLPAWLGAGSENKVIPAELLNMPLVRVGHVVRGVLDGDDAKATAQFGQTSPVLALQVAEFFLRSGEAASIYVRYPEDKKDAYFVNHNQPEGRTTHRTWRVEDTLLAKVSSVEETRYIGQVYNLSVEGDPSYTVQNILVHNCSERDSWDGEECKVCGFITPPSEFMDPDLSKAQETDLRQDAQDDPDATGLTCDTCGAQFADSAAPTPAVGGPTVPPVPAASAVPQAQGHKRAVVLDPNKGTGLTEVADTSLSAGDPCPDCGTGTLVADGLDGEVGADGFAPAGSAPDADAADPAADADPTTDPGDAAEDDDAEDDDSGDKPDFLKGKPKKKDPKKPVAARRRTAAPHRPARASQKEQIMRPALAALAEQQKQINELTKAVAFIANVAGVSGHRSVSRLVRRAADENPANSGWAITTPPGQQGSPQSGPAALNLKVDDDAVNIGASPLTDVSPDAQTSPTSVDTILNEPLHLNVQDVTKQVAGTEDLGKGDRGKPGTNRIDTDVRVGDPTDPHPAFSDGGYLSGPDAKAASAQSRTFASLRLARLQIEAGIATGDDLALSQAIASSRVSNEVLQAQIETLAQVASASSASTARRAPGSRALVPRSTRTATRSVPSMSEGAPQPQVSTAVSAEEMLFE